MLNTLPKFYLQKLEVETWITLDKQYESWDVPNNGANLQQMFFLQAKHVVKWLEMNVKREDIAYA